MIVLGAIWLYVRGGAGARGAPARRRREPAADAPR